MSEGDETGDEKERRYARKERRNAIERERKREAARVKAGGRERRVASACPAEGARRPHMCSETNVRSECRLLPIIRCRGVPLCARGWSADSVPRFYAARQPGPVRARGYPRKPRAKCVASRGRRPCGSRLGLNPRPSSRPQGWSRGRGLAVEGCGRRRTAGLFVAGGVARVSIWNGRRRALRGRVRACAFCGKCRRWRWHSMIDDDGGGLRRTGVCACACAQTSVHTSHRWPATRACISIRVRAGMRACMCVRALLCAHGNV